MLSKSSVLKLIKEEEVVEVLRELIRRPSQNPPGNEKAVAEYIYKTMKNWGFQPQYVYKPEPERPSVGVVYKGTKGKPRLVLNGHIDVVPEGDPACMHDAGIPAISWGPGWRKSHELDECVEINQVVDCVKILVLTIFDLLE